ncbi:MAG: cytochrome c biogenesis protein CcdA [Spirochaetales bacterium]|nr:cytochrome c biogenesis protein CcdA [Spirochaetales bacterium]MCF7937092.1 cytochrome c biogenesis protein CcdA [Spirochaetales bacterium]
MGFKGDREDYQEPVSAMSEVPNLAIAFAAGLLSFLSPCVFPLIPSYISFIGGASLQELRANEFNKTQVFFKSLAFVFGFAIVFVVLGVAFSGSGLLMAGVSNWVNIIAGSVVILLGVNIIFDFWSFLNYEQKIHVDKKPAGIIGAGVMGMAFGGGWSPCVGPILAGILFMASQSGQITTGIVYLLVYSFGLGLPFLAASIFFGSFIKQLNKLKKHLPTIQRISGVFLIIIGLFIAFGQLAQINRTLFSTAYSLQEWNQADPVRARIITGIWTLIAASLVYLPWIIRKLRRDRQPKRTFFAPARTVYGVLFIALAVMEFAGAIDLIKVISSWFLYQGI